jgi:glycosyltransferase involved in cell wall biosynthesis
LSPQKGLILAFAGPAEIIELISTSTSVICGRERQIRRGTSQVKSEATGIAVAVHFHVLGSRRDVTDFLHACDVFVFPSLYEGLGIALIEAMAAGLPVRCHDYRSDSRIRGRRKRRHSGAAG